MVWNTQQCGPSRRPLARGCGLRWAQTGSQGGSSGRASGGQEPGGRRNSVERQELWAGLCFTNTNVRYETLSSEEKLPGKPGKRLSARGQGRPWNSASRCRQQAAWACALRSQGANVSKMTSNVIGEGKGMQGDAKKEMIHTLKKNNHVFQCLGTENALRTWL